MKSRHDFSGVKFTSRAWSISSLSGGNVGYLSRALSQAVAFIPSSMAAALGGALEDLVDAELIVVKNIETVGDDVVIVLQDVAEETSVSVKLEGQAVKKPALIIGAIVKMRSVSSGYVLLLVGPT